MVLCTGFTRGRKARISISWYFFTGGAVLGNWAAVLPRAKAEQALSNASLGAALTAAIAGAMCALPLVSWVTRRWGSGAALFLSSVLSLLLFPLLGARVSLSLFVAAIFLLGLGLGAAGVAMNAQAVLCERVTRLPTLSLFHAVFALGALAGALSGGALSQRDFSVLRETVVVAAVLLAPQIFLSCWLYSQQEERLFASGNVLPPQHSRSFLHQPSCDKRELRDTHRLIGLPTSDAPSFSSFSFAHERLLGETRQAERERHAHTQGAIDEERQTDWQVYERPPPADRTALLVISAMCFLGYLGVGSVGDWSAIYLDEDLRCDALRSSLAFAGFSLCMALGTFRSASLAACFGRRLLLQCAGVVAAAGLAVAAAAKSVVDPDLALACAVAGFSLCGAGLSVVSPTVISLAGDSVEGVAPSDAITFVSSLGYAGIMIGPPLLGGISAILQGLRWSFVIDAVLMLSITVLACFLKLPRHGNRENPFFEHHEEITIQ